MGRQGDPKNPLLPGGETSPKAQRRRYGVASDGEVGSSSQRKSPIRITLSVTGTPEGRMHAFDPAVMRDVTLLIIAITGLIKAIWPNGIRR